jgi:flagellin-like protein
MSDKNMVKRVDKKRESENFLSKNILNKKGLSPIVTTMLLVALTIAIIVIIFFWFRSMVEEGVLKLDKNIELSCEDVVIGASYSSGILSITNDGNINVFSVDVKIADGGSHTTKRIDALIGGENWPEVGLPNGGIFSGDFSEDIEDGETVTLFPILMGSTSSGTRKTYVCGGRYGKNVEI